MRHGVETICKDRMFRRLYRSGKSIVKPLFVVYYRRNGLDRNRIGITASKTIGIAVQRNRARRVLREAYRLSQNQIAKGYDLILVARTRTSCVSMNVIQQELLAALKKEGLLLC